MMDHKVVSVTNGYLSTMPANPSYALVAISNQNRASSFRDAVAATLEIETVVVRDGDEVTAEIGRQGPPKLLVVDLSLPRVDGFAVVRKIRRQASEAETRIIVVAAHESLRSAARELALPLEIAAVLPLDIDQAALTDVLVAESRAMRRASHAGISSTARKSSPPDLDDIVDRAAIEARRRFAMPASIGYSRVDDVENLTFHVAAREPGPVIVIGDVTDFGFLRQVADTTDSLVIPNIESHPVFAQLLLKGQHPVRGFAAVPIASSRENIRAAICILDAKPLTLSAADVDDLVMLARTLGQDIDRALTPGRGTRSSSRLSSAVDSEEMKALQHLAATDPLTGLSNRRGGERHIANEISRAKRERRPLSCVLIDLDRFKQVNDTFGHQAGDQLLRDVSNLLRRTMRAYDILVRWGGEEFLLVLPGVDSDAARMLAERMRIVVEALDTHGIGPVTLSAGVAGFESDYDFAATLKTADRRLYQAKASGRNCVV
jgi:diguanylate cyclase (GGDEF)-like protein